MNSKRKDLIEVLRKRSALWEQHPVIMASAVVATPALKAAYALIRKAAMKGRSSIAFWGSPLVGKSSCIEAIIRLLKEDYPGCGILLHEPSQKVVPAEGPLLEEILDDIDFTAPVARTLAGKRRQVFRALHTMAMGANHLFIIIDEAQGLHERELMWFKRIINRQVMRRLKVTVILFGQEELMDLKLDLVASGRSDLHARYTRNLYAYENLKSPRDLKVVLTAYDSRSEFPPGSGWPFTLFLWPRAFDSGFSLAEHYEVIWEAFLEASPVHKLAYGLSMQWIADLLSQIATDTRDEDRARLMISKERWQEAVVQIGYVEHKPRQRHAKKKSVRKQAA